VGSDLNPTLELGPIREIIIDSTNAVIANVTLLAIPAQGPLDDFITARPDQPTTVDVLFHATNAAPAAGLSPPLWLSAFTQPADSGGHTVLSTDKNGSSVIQYTPGVLEGSHPVDSFKYTVQDSLGKLATGTVYITINTPPVITIKHNFPFVGDSDFLLLKHGTPGPFTGDIMLSDAEGDPMTLKLLGPALHGQVTLTEISPTHYTYEYDPPAISAYDPNTGLTRTVSNIVGSDEFTLEASDGIDVSDQTVQFDVNDLAPTVTDVGFVVPENVGISYYARISSRDSHYDPTLDHPGLVHFAAPGVLWHDTDPDSDPLMAFSDAGYGPSNGTLQLFPDGSFNYTPKPGFTGRDTFGFFASDGYMNGVGAMLPDGTTPSIVSILVLPPGTGNAPRVPVIGDDYYELDAVRPPSLAIPDLLGLSSPYAYNTGLITLGIFNPFVVRAPGAAAGAPSDAYSSIQIDPRYAPLSAASYLSGFDINDFDATNKQISNYELDININTLHNYIDDKNNVEITVTYATRPPSDILDSMEAKGIKHLASNLAEVHFIVHIAAAEVILTDPYTGGDVIVQSPPGTTLSDVKFTFPLPAGAPPDVGFTWLLGFTVTYPEDSTNSILVTIVLPKGTPHITTYYKYLLDPMIGWSPFMYDPAHGQTTGAEIETDADGQQTIVLHLIGTLGTVSDPGGPGFFKDPAGNYVASLYEDVLGRGPTSAELAHWVRKLDRGESRLEAAQAIWTSDEHRRVQVDQWSMQFLGNAPDARQQARWVNLLRRGRGEVAVEQAILTSPEYHGTHSTMASFLAGLNHDVLGQAGDPINPAQGRSRRQRTSVTRAEVARQVLTSLAAAAILAQQDATFLGRQSTAQEISADQVQLGRSSDAPARIAERILASKEFDDFVNSGLPLDSQPSRSARQAHQPVGHMRGR
jgi:hypothetical protein